MSRLEGFRDAALAAPCHVKLKPRCPTGLLLMGATMTSNTQSCSGREMAHTGTGGKLLTLWHLLWPQAMERSARCCCSRQGRPLYAVLQRRPASPSNFQRSRAHQTAVTARAPTSYRLQTGRRRPGVQHRPQPQARWWLGSCPHRAQRGRARARAHAASPTSRAVSKRQQARCRAPRRPRASTRAPRPPPAGAWRPRRPACPHPPRAPGPG